MLQLHGWSIELIFVLWWSFVSCYSTAIQTGSLNLSDDLDLWLLTSISFSCPVSSIWLSTALRCCWFSSCHSTHTDRRKDECNPWCGLLSTTQTNQDRDLTEDFVTLQSVLSTTITKVWCKPVMQRCCMISAHTTHTMLKTTVNQANKHIHDDATLTDMT